MSKMTQKDLELKLIVLDLESKITALEGQLDFCKKLIHLYQISIKVWTPLKSVKVEVNGQTVDLIGGADDE